MRNSVSNHQHLHNFNQFYTLKLGFHTTMVGTWEVLPVTGFCPAGAARRRCLNLQKSSYLLNLLRQSLSFAQFQDCPNISTQRERAGFGRSLREIKMSKTQRYHYLCPGCDARSHRHLLCKISRQIQVRCRV